jgi:hypothetical protein
MTEEDQIKACAELDGWTFNGHVWEKPECESVFYPSVFCEASLPNYSSRDVLIPLIQKCINQNPDNEDDGGVMAQFQCALLIACNICNLSIDDVLVVQTLICASPSQLREALLRTTGKWKE